MSLVKRVFFNITTDNLILFIYTDYKQPDDFPDVKNIHLELNKINCMHKFTHHLQPYVILCNNGCDKNKVSLQIYEY